MIYHQKNQSNRFEKALTKLLNEFGMNAYSYLNSGIDIYLKDLNIFIEVKSSYRYSSYSCKTRKQTIRYSHYSFKPNELNTSINYYLFIEKVNKMNDLKYIKRLNIFIVKAKNLKKYFIYLNKDLNNRLQVSVNRINSLPKYNLQQFIEMIID